MTAKKSKLSFTAKVIYNVLEIGPSSLHVDSRLVKTRTLILLVTVSIRSWTNSIRHWFLRIYFSLSNLTALVTDILSIAAIVISLSLMIPECQNLKAYVTQIFSFKLKLMM